MPVGLGGERLWLCPTLGGDRLDLSGNGNHGTYRGGMGTGADKYKGGSRAYSFDGSNDVVRVSNDLTLANDITIAAHAKSFDPNALAIVAGNLLEASPYPQNYILYQYLGSWRANVKFSGSSWTTVIGPPVASGQWVHLTLVRSAARSNIRLYVDGSLYGTTASSGTVVTTPQMYFAVGARPKSASTEDAFFDGSCDDIRLFQRALTPEEIKHLASYRGIQGSPYYKPPTVKSRVIRLLSDRDTTVTSKLISVKRNNSQVDPSFKAGYAQSPSESAHPNLWDGLVGAWMPSLGVTGGTLRDVSGNENHGTLTNMDAATDWVGTSKGKALYFDNNVHKVDYNTNFEPAFDRSYTFSCLVNFFAADDRDVLFGNYDGGSSWLNFERHTSNRLRHVFRFTSSSFLDDYTGNNVVSAGWNYINFTRQRLSSTQSNLIYHVNGREVRNATVTYLDRTLGNPHFYLGGDIRNTFTNLNGQIAWASIYNRALSPDEIQTLYVDSLAPFRKKQQIAFNAYPLTLLEKIRSAAKPTTPVSVRVKHNEEPSYKAGYAKSAGESENPHLWKGLVGAWMPSLGVTGETLRDVSGNGNHGVSTDVSWEVFSNRKSLLYNGSTSKSEIDSTSKFAVQKMSACIWFKINSVNLSNYTHIFWKKKSTAPFSSFGLWIQQSTRNIYGGFGQFHESTGSQLPLNEWIFATLTYDGEFRRIFLNGSLDVEASDTSLAIQYDANPIQIGFGDYNLELNGLVSGASIYNRALSPQEIQELYVDSLAPFRRKAKPIGYQPNKELIGLFKV